MGIFVVFIVIALNIIFRLNSNNGNVVVGDFTKEVSINHQIRTIRYNFSSPLFKKDCHEILIKKFPYYVNLSELNKEHFLKRLVIFIQSKKMVPCEMPEVTLEMRVLISATAIQLTFGLDNSALSNVKGFRIYPDIYYSKLMNTRFKGHFAPNGVITLAYNYFMSTLEEINGINLGLHEMAHALHFTYIKQHHTKYLYTDIIASWYQRVKNQPVDELHPAESFLLREYCKTNDKEFFAVCVENFFERPQQFREVMPQLYKCLCMMLNQNPIRETDRKFGEFVPTFEETASFVFKSNIGNYFGFLPLIIFSGLMLVAKMYIPGLILLTLLALLLKFNTSTGSLIEFCEDYITIKPRFKKRNKTYLNLNSILYLAFIDIHLDSDSQNKLTIAYENEKLNIHNCSIDLSQSEQKLLREYCNRKNILLVEKRDV